MSIITMINPLDFLIAPYARSYPFQYASNEQLELIPYRVPSYPYEGPGVQSWLSDLYSPGQVAGTFELLNHLNTRIYESFKYARREEAGVQLPCQIIALPRGLVCPSDKFANLLLYLSALAVDSRRKIAAFSSQVESRVNSFGADLLTTM